MLRPTIADALSRTTAAASPFGWLVLVVGALAVLATATLVYRGALPQKTLHLAVAQEETSCHVEEAPIMPCSSSCNLDLGSGPRMAAAF